MTKKFIRYLLPGNKERSEEIDIAIIPVQLPDDAYGFQFYYTDSRYTGDFLSVTMFGQIHLTGTIMSVGELKTKPEIYKQFSSVFDRPDHEVYVFTKFNEYVYFDKNHMVLFRDFKPLEMKSEAYPGYRFADQ